MYEEQIGTRLIVSAVLTLVSLSMLGYYIWARPLLERNHDVEASWDRKFRRRRKEG